MTMPHEAEQPTPIRPTCVAVLDWRSERESSGAWSRKPAATDLAAENTRDGPGASPRDQARRATMLDPQASAGPEADGTEMRIRIALPREMKGGRKVERSKSGGRVVIEAIREREPTAGRAAAFFQVARRARFKDGAQGSGQRGEADSGREVDEGRRGRLPVSENPRGQGKGVAGGEVLSRFQR